MPDPARVERRRRAAVEDAVEVAPADAGEARVPVVGDLLDREDRDRLRPHQRVQPFAQPVRGQRFAMSTCAVIASAWTPASVRPAAWTRRQLAGHPLNALPRAPAGPTAHAPAAASP